MRFDVFGRFVLEVLREGEAWTVWHLGGDGKRRRSSIVIPPDVPEAEISTYLADLFHEGAGEDREVRRLS